MNALLRPLQAFFRTEALGGTVLVLATVAALVWANSPAAGSYHAIWARRLAIGVEGFQIAKPLILWINDFLMAIFFLLVGLEIKRELLVGELNGVRKAALPAIAALGGMAVPAAVFLAIARGEELERGFGIPMATDIAFALGCLRMLGSRIPAGLVVMLAALAIIDDLGAIILIAVFYSTDVSLAALGAAAAFAGLLAAMNLGGVRRPLLYALAGLPLWVAVLKSGVHATIAGVIIGLAVPARAAEGEEESPLVRLEHALHPFVAFAIVPIFALANAGIPLRGIAPADVLSPVSLGVFAGLLLGKQVGVFGATAVAVKLGIASLPAGVTWRQAYGLSILAGIGFTMSLFIAGLAYGEGTALHGQAKRGILAASLVAGVAGVALLAGSGRAASEPTDAEAEGSEL